MMVLPLLFSWSVAVQVPVAPVPAPVQVPASPAVTVEFASGVIVPSMPIRFEAATAQPATDSAATFAAIAAFLASKESMTTVRVEGHVDGVAADAAQALSEQRALAVVRGLVAAGVDCKRLLPVGFGDNKPVADRSTPAGRAENTRIHVVVAALRGHAIGGMPVDGGGQIVAGSCK